MVEQETVWTQSRIDLIKRTICPKGIGDDEFALFIEQCKRSGLDPLLKEAFCVPRKMNVGNRERPQWVTKYEFQPSEAGMLARAERFPDFRGISAQAVHEGDLVKVKSGEGVVEHEFDPTQRKPKLIGAWARVGREGKVSTVVWLDLAGYVQDSPLWRKIPDTMCEKCARVAALRKAYPSAFGGLYIREEMPPEEVGSPALTLVEERPTARTEALRAKVAALPAVTGSIVAQTLTAAREVRESVPVVVDGPAPKPLPSMEEVLGPTVAFGPSKGRPLPDLADDELAEAIGLAEKDLQAHPRSKYAKTLRTNLGALEAEAQRRSAEVPEGEEMDEPGANG